MQNINKKFIWTYLIFFYKVLYSEEENSTAITLPNQVDLQGNLTKEKSLFQQRIKSLPPTQLF